MFLHIFKYRLLTMLKAKEEVFWEGAFPIILVTCFWFAFSNLENAAYVFHSIPVAVVYQEENESFQKTLETVASDTGNGEEFLKVTVADEEQAKQMLEEETVTAVITVGDSVGVTVSKTGINQTAVVSFVNEYLQKEALIKEVLAVNPAALEQVMESMADTGSYIENASFGNKKFGVATGYYFSLIAMAVLFGGYFGINCARNMRADSTAMGMRKCVAPAKRGMLIAAEFLATYLLQIIMLAVLLTYMIGVLKVDLLDYIGYVIGTCLVGSLVGISSGILIGSIPRLKEGGQVGVFTAYSLGSSFLAGLMSHEMKILIANNAPFIAKINPATLIQDSLYSLAVYDTYTRYYENMITLAIMALILLVLSYLITRRKDYASL